MDTKTYIAIKDYLRIIIQETEFENNLFAVGGCCRDEILGNNIKDLDLVVTLENGGIKFAEWLDKNNYTNGTVVTYPRYGTAMFKLKNFPDEELEVVQTRAEIYSSDSRKPDTTFGTLKQDCMRRDLTINAIYYDISNSKFIDVTNRSFDDIKNKIIVTPCDPNQTYIDDPLRIMRCVRFACKLGWNIDKDVFNSMKKNIDRLSIISKERIQDEFMKILKTSNSTLGINYLFNIGAMKYIFPYLHSLYNNVPNHMNIDFDKTYKCYLKLALINLSNINVKEDLINLKFSTFEINTIINYINVYFDMSKINSQSSDIDIRKMLYKCKTLNIFLDVYNMIVIYEDNNDKLKSIHDIICKGINCDDLMKMFEYKLPINGNDIMRTFNIKPGHEIKEYLDKGLELVFEFPFITKDELLNTLKVFKK